MNKKNLICTVVMVVGVALIGYGIYLFTQNPCKMGSMTNLIHDFKAAIGLVK
jgi:hypothetical protein